MLAISMFYEIIIYMYYKITCCHTFTQGTRALRRASPLTASSWTATSRLSSASSSRLGQSSTQTNSRQTGSSPATSRSSSASDRSRRTIREILGLRWSAAESPTPETQTKLVIRTRVKAREPTQCGHRSQGACGAARACLRPRSARHPQPRRSRRCWPSAPPGLPGRKVVDDAPGVEDTRPAEPIPVMPLPHLIEMGLRPQISSMRRTAGLLPCAPHLN